MRLLSKSGLTVIEVIVVLFVIVVFIGFLTIPSLSAAMRKGQMLQIVNNMRQIQQITASAALDRGVTGDTNIIGWPGTNIGFSVWVRSLTNASISEKVIEKLFSGPGVKVDGFPEYAQGKTAYRVYQVSEDSATNTVFLSTYSWNAEAPNTDGKGFVIMHKDGRGVSYSAKQATNTNGEYFGILTKNINP